MTSNYLCKYFQEGKCQFGKDCKNIHQEVKTKLEKDNETLKIGIVGFSKECFDKSEAQMNLEECIEAMIKIHKPKKVSIVSGLTFTGVPKLSYEYGKIKSYKTVGITAKRALNARIFPCDTIYVFGDKYGDESEKFIEYRDVLIRVGGGKQSRNEVEMLKRK